MRRNEGPVDAGPKPGVLRLWSVRLETGGPAPGGNRGNFEFNLKFQFNEALSR
jgi:hypothetical protein